MKTEATCLNWTWLPHQKLRNRVACPWLIAIRLHLWLLAVRGDQLHLGSVFSTSEQHRKLESVIALNCKIPLAELISISHQFIYWLSDYNYRHKNYLPMQPVQWKIYVKISFHELVRYYVSNYIDLPIFCQVVRNSGSKGALHITLISKMQES